jgi:hypothetical protein
MATRTRAAIGMVVSLGLAACGSGGGAGGDDDDDAIDAAPIEADASYGDSWSVSWGPYEIPALTEETRCVTKRLGNDTPIKIGKIRNQLAAGSHHLIVYRVGEGEESPDPTPCQPFQDVLKPEAGQPLGITQVVDETITLPVGVAFELEADQLIRLEMHYVNATTEPLMAEATTTVVEIPEADFRDAADFLFVGNPDIHISPNSAFELPTPFLGMPPELITAKVFALTGHQHQWGTGVTVELGASPEGPFTSIYAPEDFKWDEPPTVYHRPSLEIPAGGGFKFDCSYMNLSEDEVGFGESADDEMCFFWAYYYPSNGARVCFYSDEYDVEGCCPGHPLCALVDKL